MSPSLFAEAQLERDPCSGLYVVVYGQIKLAVQTDRGDEMVVELPAPKGVIASRLNLTHEHFSRILRELITAGLIEVDGREVRILNKERLFGYAS